MSALRIEGQFEDIRHGLPMVDHLQTMSARISGDDRDPAACRPRLRRIRSRLGAPGRTRQRIVRGHYWPNESAVGKRIGQPWASPWITIVGVVADAKLDSLTGTSEETVYRPLAQNPLEEMTLVVRTSAPERASRRRCAAP